MSNQINELNPQDSLSIIKLLRKDISALETQIVLLERKHSQSPFWLQLLRNWFTTGPVKELEWIYFKLNLKRKDLVIALQ